MRWVQKYQDEQSVTRKTREYTAYKVHQKFILRAKELLRRNPAMTMKKMAEVLKEEFDDFDVTPQWFGHVLRDNNITRKRTRVVHEPETRFKKEINIQEELATFYGKIRKYPLNKIISIDESSIEPFRSKSYSRCKLKRRCVIKTKDNVVFQKYSLILAVTTQGPELWQMFDKGSVFAERLEEFLTKLLKNKKGFLVLLDNAPAHKKAIKGATSASYNQT